MLTHKALYYRLTILYISHRKYRCLIRVAENKEKKFLICLDEPEVYAKRLEFKRKLIIIIILFVINLHITWIIMQFPCTSSQSAPTQEDTAAVEVQKDTDTTPVQGDTAVPAQEDADLSKPTYRDFFMAMAFLARARSKDNKYQVLHFIA